MCSGYGYGFMMRNTTLDQTLQAKSSFERELSKHGVKVQACRADNGRFAELGFKNEVESCNQTIFFCGLGPMARMGLLNDTSER